MSTRPLAEPNDVVRGLNNAETPLRVLDFWRWAFSDLCDDDVKGWLAEWYVGHLLGLPMSRRVSWANSDLITPTGARIEVKASAYWQSWKLVDELGHAINASPLTDASPSKVRFSGLRARDSVGTRPDARALKSDLYVFAFQGQLDPAAWDALDLSAWEFYMLDRDALEALGCASISLTRLRSLAPRMDSAEFANAGRAWLAGFKSST